GAAGQGTVGSDTTVSVRRTVCAVVAAHGGRGTAVRRAVRCGGREGAGRARRRGSPDELRRLERLGRTASACLDVRVLAGFGTVRPRSGAPPGLRRFGAARWRPGALPGLRRFGAARLRSGAPPGRGWTSGGCRTS